MAEEVKTDTNTATATPPISQDEILRVKGLCSYFFTEDGIVRALEDVNLAVRKGETMGIVGESGSGKSVTALSITGLLPMPPGKVLEGTAWFNCSNGKTYDLLTLSRRGLQKLRGRYISFIFQDPMSSLNPLFTLGDQIMESLKENSGMNESEAKEKAIELLNLVGIPAAESRIESYPHEFSGGMRQRVMVAIAIANNPDLLIADEPTTALDVTIQAQVLELMEEIKNEIQSAILLITHDMGVIAEHSDSVTVMYAGYDVESAEVIPLFKNPRHPYTIGLLGAIPRADEKIDELRVIPGAIPNLLHPPGGCRFHPRCERATAICSEEVPARREIEKGHFVRCHHVD